MKHFFIALFLVLGLVIFPHTIMAVLPSPDVTLSATSFKQADTLLVVVKNEPAQITGSLGSVKMRFFRDETNNDWVSLVGMPVNKTPGTYTLTVVVPGKALFKKNITVAKRKFPITALVVTPELTKKGYTVKKIVETISNDENKALNNVLSIINPSAYFTKPFAYPLSEITVVGDYGDIRAAKNYQIQHLGVDVKAPQNTPVYAVNDGNVVFVKSLPDYGNTVIIDHGLGIYSLYLHLADFKVENGQAVKQGDIIGLSGATGYATGPHLHFSIKVRGASVDPLKFIQATQAEW